MAGEKPRVPQLNMNHGFMHSIIKNQIDRDEYDKEQKLLKLQKDKEASVTAAKEERKRKDRRAPLTQVYIPPHQRKNITSPGNKISIIHYHLLKQRLFYHIFKKNLVNNDKLSCKIR